MWHAGRVARPRSGPSKSWIKVKNPKAPGVLRLEAENAEV